MTRRRGAWWLTLVVLVTLTSCATKADRTGQALQTAMNRLVSRRDGPPGVIAVVQRGSYVQIYTAGAGKVGDDGDPLFSDHMRLASTSKAFSGAVALFLVEGHRLALTDTIGTRLAGQGLPEAWSAVTLAQLLQHTSGVPDYTASPAFGAQFSANPAQVFDSRRLWTAVANEPLEFTPGSSYAYSNTDNILVALMAETATGKPYEELLSALVYRPLGLRETTLPRGPELPVPFMHGYVVDPPGPPEDISRAISASGPWASGGIVSTPADLNSFARGYVGARLFSRRTQARQMTWVDGNSSYPGPGKNSSGLGLFRYEARCGTVYGHTGSIPGYSQFFAATLDGRRSVTVSINQAVSEKVESETMEKLRGVDEEAVCVALTD